MSENKAWHVYLLRCADGKIYTGSTGNLDQRIIAHRKGEGSLYLTLNTQSDQV